MRFAALVLFVFSTSVCATEKPVTAPSPVVIHAPSHVAITSVPNDVGAPLRLKVADLCLEERVSLLDWTSRVVEDFPLTTPRLLIERERVACTGGEAVASDNIIERHVVKAWFIQLANATMDQAQTYSNYALVPMLAGDTTTMTNGTCIQTNLRLGSVAGVGLPKVTLDTARLPCPLPYSSTVATAPLVPAATVQELSLSLFAPEGDD